MKNATAAADAPAAAPAAAPADAAADANATAPAVAPTAGSKAGGCQTPLAFLQNSGSYKKLVQMVDATPPAAKLADILDSPDVAITVLAPTDDAITESLSKQGLDFSDLVANPALTLMVLQYHLLPNPIPSDQFLNGYSFNTLLPGDNFQDAIGVSSGGSGGKIKLKGPHNTATLSDSGNPSCLSTVYTIDGLLLPKRAIAGGAGGAAGKAAGPAAGDATAAAGDAAGVGAAAPAEGAAAAGPAAAKEDAPPPAPKPKPAGARRAEAAQSGAASDPNAAKIVEAP